MSRRTVTRLNYTFFFDLWAVPRPIAQSASSSDMQYRCPSGHRATMFFTLLTCQEILSDERICAMPSDAFFVLSYVLDRACFHSCAYEHCVHFVPSFGEKFDRNWSG